ncbi:TonB-dependent receptor domain-containing protein [Azospirillum sp.]|uniref:TonB-dependent receptor domain-containing protein n=1 Tax=Azospirillum sp. TaxID=34012 RepID=UPI003D71C453
MPASRTLRPLAPLPFLLLSVPAIAQDGAMRLDPVSVTATRTEHTASEAPATVTIINADEIAAKGAADLQEAVRSTPGISLLGQQVGGRKTFSIRGTDNRHTLVLIDGRRISATDDVIGHSDYQYGWIPMGQVERIEVVRGPMSALYGSEAMGGVVNIITKKTGKIWTAQGTVRGDLNPDAGGDGRQVAVSAGGPLGDKVSVGFSAEDFREAAVPLPGTPLLSELEGRSRRGGTLDLTFRPVEGHEVSVNLLESRETRWRGNQETSGARRYFTDSYDLDRSQRSVGYRGDWGVARSEIRYTETEFDVTNSRTLGIAPTRPQNLKDRILDGNVIVPVGERQVVTAGGEHRTETLRNAGLLGGEDSATHKALYLQDEIVLTDTVSVTLGGRRDVHQTFGAELSPRAYVVWKATPSLIVKGGYGEAFRAPTLKQISPNYVGAEGPHTFLGNANVRPETSRTWEIGFDWAGQGRSLAASIFRNDFDDLIDTRLVRVQGARRTYIYDNISHARIDGLEAAGRQELGAGFALSANYLYLHATNRDTGADLEGRPRHSGTLGLDWESGPWQSRLSAEYLGRQYLSGTAGPTRAPSYTLLHLTGSYQINENLRLRAGLNNIGDVRLADKSPLFPYAERGRTVYVAMNASF